MSEDDSEENSEDINAELKTAATRITQTTIEKKSIGHNY